MISVSSSSPLCSPSLEGAPLTTHLVPPSISAADLDTQAEPELPAKSGTVFYGGR